MLLRLCRGLLNDELRKQTTSKPKSQIASTTWRSFGWVATGASSVALTDVLASSSLLPCQLLNYYCLYCELHLKHRHITSLTK